MFSSLPTKILIGISLDSDVSKELLSWAIGHAARPNDTIVGLHIVETKGSSKKLQFDRNQFRLAKAFVISLLGDYAETCQSKQVNLEAKVGTSKSIAHGLIDEATLIGATFLIVGGSRNQNGSHRSSPGITNYCFKHAPKGCSMVSIGIGSKPNQDLESEFMGVEDFHESRLSTKDSNKIKRLFGSKNKSNRNSPSQSLWDKPSPRAVLDGPYREEDSSSIGDSSMTESPPQAQPYRSRSKIWKNLSIIKLLFPFPRLSFDGTVKEGRESISDNNNRQPTSRCFSYEEISNATNNFNSDNMVGQGGYSEVYRGDLYDGRTIAVKRLTNDSMNETKQKEFLMELGILVHVCHPNTAYLIGYCIENGFYLIFNFSTNGNLASALHGTSNMLDWQVRYKIAIGVAKGLHYLHKCCKHRIIHRDIKASNVLLGPDFEPQITDFGLAKWLPKQWTHHSVFPIEGTFGYLAPEYFMHGIVDEKTDVFAFGVLLLEIITGREPIDLSKQNLLSWAKPLIDSEDITGLADPMLEGKYDVDQIHNLVLTASYCIRQSSLSRPSMNEVLQLLTDVDRHSNVLNSFRMPNYVVDEIDDYTEDIDNGFPTSEIFS